MHIPTNIDQLQNLWHNIKVQMKKEYSAQRRSAFFTGGGSAETGLTDVSELAVETFGNENLEPLQGIGDDDVNMELVSRIFTNLIL